jgi:predicted nucleotide-binding protein (sugar kinase/HSP70/actin superfamily)
MNPSDEQQLLDPDLEAELADFEARERQRLGLPDTESSAQWRDANPQTFRRDQRDHTTILHGGLTYAQDLFTMAALRGLGYKMKTLDVPDNDALQFGREYGNRGQCNPTYFTVGNLIKHLTQLRDEQGLSTEEIIDGYLFVTAGACGPCRFGTYVTEYRKALRDAGFDGFRVMLFQQQGGLKQATGGEVGLEMNAKFFWAFIKALVIGDVLNALMYRIRPYEVEEGATDRAIEASRALIAEALETRGNLITALYKVRRLLAAVKVDRTQVKPKVAIIGEFWAMTTEGDGNYQLQRFLESEGAEVDIQLVTAWVLYMIWQGRYDTQLRATLRGADGGRGGVGRYGLAGVDVRKRTLALEVADRFVRAFFQTVAHGMGLYDYHLPDMNEIAEVSHAFYDNSLRGGEGHMEVGKLILNVAKSKVNLTLSVKPFGCMPSSSVSDGVQSLITEMYPDGLFLPIETSGDGAVNVYSRVQMQLFKARQIAQREVDQELERAGLTMADVRGHLGKSPRLAHPFHKSRHVAGCTAADLVAEVSRRRRRGQELATSLRRLVGRKAPDQRSGADLVTLARSAAQRARTQGARAQAAPPADEAWRDARRPPPAPPGRRQLPVV